MNALAYTTFIVCPPAFFFYSMQLMELHVFIFFNLFFFFYFVVCFFICVVGIKNTYICIFILLFYIYLLWRPVCHLLSDAIHNFFLFILISSSICFYFLFSVLILFFIFFMFFKGLKLMRIDVISLYSEIIMNTSCDELTFNITSLLITFRQMLITSFSMSRVNCFGSTKGCHDVNQLANTHALYHKVQMCWFDTSVCEWKIKIIDVNNT